MKGKQPIRSAVAEALKIENINPALLLERKLGEEAQYFDGEGTPDVWGIACNLPEWKLNDLRLDESTWKTQSGLVPVGREFFALFFLQQFAGWQHRLLLPLVGPTVRRVIQSIAEGTSSFEVVFHADTREDIVECGVTIDDSALRIAASVHVDQVALGALQISSGLLEVGMLLKEEEIGHPYDGVGKQEPVFVSILHYPELMRAGIRLADLATRASAE